LGSIQVQIRRWRLKRGLPSGRVGWLIQQAIAIVLATILAVILIAQATTRTVAQLPPQPDEILPTLQPHLLPLSLAQWHPVQSDDYFSQISSTPVGYLVWSEFPIKVFIEPTSENEPATNHAQEWILAATRAVQEWNLYLPLAIIEDSEAADIAIWRRSPPLISRAAGTDIDLRARSAETRYELFIDRLFTPAILAHRFQILLRPGQTATYLQAAARHELGHALGIWGHSPLETDALYFSQVRSPSALSSRDINTLKRIYEQPTSLGWSVEPVSMNH
jgi:predicted Zn-dependent protease